MTDAQALATFETLVKSQEPATAKWIPVTDYSAQVRDIIEGPMPDLVVSTLHPKRVLDAGCGYGYLVRALAERGIDASGFDVQDYREWMQSPKFGFGEVDNLNGVCPFTGTFDLVVCREVLEHLTIRQIRQAVRNICAWTTKYVYVTTRFHPDPKHLLDVATTDTLDPTHITMLNQDLLRALFVLEGMTRRPALETALDWMQYGRVLVYEKG